MAELREDDIIRAFHMMWDNYDEPVRLIRKDFTVVAGSKRYLANGGQIGGKCNTGNPELHKGCQAMNALRSGETKRVQTVMAGVDWDSYWVPVEGSDEYYVHFTNGINEFREVMKRKAEEEAKKQG